MKERTFADIGRVEAIRLLFEGSAYTAFADTVHCSATGAGDSIASASRLLIEGTDFDLTYFPLEHLGYKAAVSVIGELLADLARPHTLSIVLGISAKLDFPQVQKLWKGVLSAAGKFGIKELALDLIPSHNGLSISVNASGIKSKITSVRQPAPKSKDLLCVSGPLGAAYLGLQVLENEKRNFEHSELNKDKLERYKMLVSAYLHPELPSNIVGELEDSEIYPSAGVFVTRGLSDALLRLCRSTSLGAKVYTDKMPFEGGSFDLGRELDLDPISAAMNGGDDLRLLFTVPILKMEKFRHDFQTFDIIGHLALPEAGCSLVTPEGAELQVTAPGWNTNQDY